MFTNVIMFLMSVVILLLNFSNRKLSKRIDNLEEFCRLQKSINENVTQCINETIDDFLRSRKKIERDQRIVNAKMDEIYNAQKRIKDLEEAASLYGRILRQHETTMKTQSEIQNAIIKDSLYLNKEI